MKASESKSKKTMQQVIRLSLVQISVLILVLVVVCTNLGFTVLFKQYVAQIRANETHMVLAAVEEVFADGQIDADERTRLRQTANQSGVHALVETAAGESVFDSTVGGNGSKRALLSKSKEVIDLDTLIYTPYVLKAGNASEVTVFIGQQPGWLLNQEDIGFVVGVNLTFLLVTAIALPLVWFLSKWLSGKLSRPIVAIHRATEDLRLGRYQNLELTKSETLELHDLAVAMENLAFQLDHQEALRQRLTTDIAHELRSPLAVIRSQLEGIQDGVLSPEPERLARLNGEIVRLTNLINDLGELTLVENNLYELQRQRLDFSLLVSQVAEDFEPIFEEKGLALIRQIQPDIWFEADAERMRQVLVNLMANAFKYTDKGHVSISLSILDKQLVVTVADTGIGISEEDLPFIFQRFYRADPSRNRQTGGAGIGLDIVNKLVRAQGGSIEAESQLGVGTVIRVCFNFTEPA